MLSNHRDGILPRTSEYASVQDFCSVFHQNMGTLYWLALTLTADEREAEQCFVAGLEECICGNSVFKEWAHSWSKRVVIKNAIRLVAPRPDASGAARSPVREKLGSQAEAAQVPFANLPPFDRFVFVMSVLEGYADRDCAALLACSPTDVVRARVRAIQQMRREIERLPALQQNRGCEPQEPVLVNGAQVA